MRKIIPKNSLLIPGHAKKVYKGKIYDVYQWDQSLYDGSHKIFEMVRRPDTVTIIGLVKNKIILIEEEQPMQLKKLKFPTGQIDKDDLSILEAAKREMKEETGYLFKNYKLLSVRQPINMEWFVFVYLAWDVLAINDPLIDPGEKITLKTNTLTEMKNLVKTNSYFRLFSDIFINSKSNEDLKKIKVFAGIEVER